MLEEIRELLIKAGVDPAELEGMEEPPIVSLIGKYLQITMENDSQVSFMLQTIMMTLTTTTKLVQTQGTKIKSLEDKVKALETKVAAIK